MWAERQFNKEEATKFAESNVWEQMTVDEIVKLQLFQKLCMVPFSLFHESLEKVLNRPVWTHEFADFESLQNEYLGKAEKPSMDDIMDKMVKLVGRDKNRVMGVVI